MKFNFRILFWPSVIIFYFATRLINLKIVPIFTDEAIYSYWAQVALHDPANRFISLDDGKQPLFVWIAAVMQKFIADPLIASRLASVFAGLGSLIGVYLLTKLLFNEKVAKIASLFYIVLPFTLLYDRMALFDSLLTMCGIYAVLFSVKMVKDPKLDNALLTGFAIGLAMITKSSGFFFLYLLPFSLVLFNFKEKDRNLRLFKWLNFAIIVFILSELIYNSLRLSPLFYIIGRKNLEFIRSFSEVIFHPFTYFFSNISAIVQWTAAYIDIPLFIIFIASVIYGIFKRNSKVIYLSVLILAPFLAEAFFNKILYPRFILFYFPYIIILFSFGVVWLFEKYTNFRKYLIILFILILISPVFSSYRLLTNPPKAKIAESDAGQYFNDWPAGYGVAQIVSIIRNESQNEEVYVGTEGTFGLLPFAIQIYFYGQNNVHVLGFWPVDSNNLPSQILKTAQNNKTYFVFNENQKEITNGQLKFVEKYQKGNGNSFMRLYKVIPQ